MKIFLKVSGASLLTLLITSIVGSRPVHALRKDIALYIGAGHQNSTGSETATLNDLAGQGYTYEEITQAEQVRGNNAYDIDGVLLYPDGSPRYGVIILGGGSAKRYYNGCCTADDPMRDLIIHGTGLGDAGRQELRSFVGNGGAYVGMCGGAYFSSYKNDVNDWGVGRYLNLWPGITNNDHGGRLDSDHLLSSHELNSQFNQRIKQVYFNGGCDFQTGVSNTSYVASFTEPWYGYDHLASNFNGKKAILAHDKGPSDPTGRVVISCSHPEVNNSSDYPLNQRSREYFKRMITYALEKKPPISSQTLVDGTRVTPDYPVGDDQFHYYYINLPSGSELIVELSDGSSPGGNNDLYLRKGDYPTLDTYDHRSMDSGPSETITVPSASADMWFIGVHGAHTNRFGEDYEILATTASSYDVNEDGQVDGNDLKLLVQNIYKEPVYTTADLNVDGVVNNIDYAILADSLTTTPETPPQEDPFIFADDADLEALWYLEETGQTRADAKGNNDLTGSATHATDHVQGTGSASFDNNSQHYLSASNSNQLAITGDLTVGGWIKPDTTSTNSVLFSKYRSPGEKAYGLVLTTDHQLYAFVGNNGTDWTTRFASTGTVSNGSWHHVAMVVDVGSDVRLYIDGQFSGSAASPSTIYNSNVNFELGHRNQADIYYDGLMDEVFVFSRTLSEQEIYDIYLSRLGDEASERTEAQKKEGYFKDLFIDGGMELSNKHAASIPAVGMLGLTSDYYGSIGDYVENVTD